MRRELEDVKADRVGTPGRLLAGPRAGLPRILVGAELHRGAGVGLRRIRSHVLPVGETGVDRETAAVDAGLMDRAVEQLVRRTRDAVEPPVRMDGFLLLHERVEVLGDRHEHLVVLEEAIGGAELVAGVLRGVPGIDPRTLIETAAFRAGRRAPRIIDVLIKRLLECGRLIGHRVGLGIVLGRVAANGGTIASVHGDLRIVSAGSAGHGSAAVGGRIESDAIRGVGRRNCHSITSCLMTDSGND